MLYTLPVGTLFGCKIVLVSPYKDRPIKRIEDLKQANSTIRDIEAAKLELLNKVSSIFRWEGMTKEHQEVYERGL